MLNAPKVLIGIPTHQAERYALVPLLQGLQKQLFQGFDILFVDNSREGAYALLLEQALRASFPERAASVVHLDAGEERFARILASRNAIRDAFLRDPSYTHLLFLDSDVLLPRSALVRMLSAKMPLVTGVYLNAVEGTDGKLEIRPALYLDVDGERARQATVREALGATSLRIGAAGLGCTLIARDVVERVPLREDPGPEDIRFYRDAVRICGVTPLALRAVKCLHLHYPLGDARNAPFDLTKYSRREKE